MEARSPSARFRKGVGEGAGGQRGHEGARRFVKQEGAPRAEVKPEKHEKHENAHE